MTALAATGVDPGATVTPEMAARLAVAPTTDARRALPFSGLSTGRLPRIDVRLTGGGDDATGDLIIRELLAEGGMGRVFLAEQRSLAREVAIKTVRDPADEGQLDALLHEGMIAGHLDHPGVTPVHLIGTSAEGETILVMKRIVGLRWSDLAEGSDEVWARFPMLPRDPLRAHLDVLMEVARTIHFAHRRGVVHLDIKPDNVMIGELGEVYVVDWGVATTLEAAAAGGGFVGTPSFVAPEVVTGGAVGPWTDVYLLGAALHWVLTGAARHRGEHLMEVLTDAARSEPWDYEDRVPAELAALANAATALSPGDRPPDALAFRAAVAIHLEHTASLALTADGRSRLALMATTEDASRAVRLATEARFAFRAALDRWPDNPEARAGLRACLVRAVELELDRENLVGARELEAELDPVPPDTAVRREALERVLAERAASAGELRRIKDEVDLGLGSAERLKLFIAMFVATLLAMAVLTHVMTVDMTWTSIVMLAPPVGGLLVFGALVWWLRRGLLANAIGRRLMMSAFVTLAAMGVHRAATVFAPLGPAGAEVRSELLLVAAVTSGLATFVSPRAWLLVLIALAGALVVTVTGIDPSHVFNATGFFAMIGLRFVFGKRGDGVVRTAATGDDQAPATRGGPPATRGESSPGT